MLHNSATEGWSIRPHLEHPVQARAPGEDFILAVAGGQRKELPLNITLSMTVFPQGGIVLEVTTTAGRMLPRNRNTYYCQKCVAWVTLIPWYHALYLYRVSCCYEAFDSRYKVYCAPEDSWNNVSLVCVLLVQC